MYLQCAYCGFLNDCSVSNPVLLLGICGVCHGELNDRNAVTVQQLLTSFSVPLQCGVCNGRHVLFNRTCTRCNASGAHSPSPFPFPLRSSPLREQPLSVDALMRETGLNGLIRNGRRHVEWAGAGPGAPAPPAFLQNLWQSSPPPPTPSVQWSSRAPVLTNLVTAVLQRTGARAQDAQHAPPPPPPPPSNVDNVRESEPRDDSYMHFSFTNVDVLLDAADLPADDDDNSDEEDDVIVFAPPRAWTTTSDDSGRTPLGARARRELVVTPVQIPPDFMCSVCLVAATDTTSAQDLLALPCSHTFHTTCIDQWFMTHCTCPVCRDHLHHRLRARQTAT